MKSIVPQNFPKVIAPFNYDVLEESVDDTALATEDNINTI